LAVGEAEIPAVIGADGAAVFDPTGGKVVTGVGANAVEDKDLLLMEKDGEGKAVGFDALGVAFGEFFEIAETDPGHDISDY